MVIRSEDNSDIIVDIAVCFVYHSLGNSILSAVSRRSDSCSSIDRYMVWGGAVVVGRVDEQLIAESSEPDSIRLIRRVVICSCNKNGTLIVGGLLLGRVRFLFVFLL